MIQVRETEWGKEERERTKKNAVKIVFKAIMLWPFDFLIATCRSSKIKKGDNWRVEKGRGVAPIINKLF